MKRQSAVLPGPRPGPRTTLCLLATLLVSLGKVMAAAIEPGEFGADLSILRRFYLAPRLQESNHHFNLFGWARLYPTMLHHGLTNNRALVVLSHGKGIVWKGAVRYGYHPGNRVWREETMPYFSAADIARVIGAAGASQIHNILIAGCNKEHAFDSSELRRCFVNATNVTHAPGGRDGYELVFRHTVTHASSDVSLLYARTSSGRASYTSSPFVPYIAELYRPGEHTPFATRIAGREFLDPSVLKISADAAAADFRETAAEIALADQRKDFVVPACAQFRAASSVQPAPSPVVLDRNSSGVIRWQTDQKQRAASTPTNGLVRWKARDAER